MQRDRRLIVCGSDDVKGDVVGDVADNSLFVRSGFTFLELVVVGVAMAVVQGLENAAFQDGHPATLSGMVVDRADLILSPAKNDEVEEFGAGDEIARVMVVVEMGVGFPVGFVLAVIAEKIQNAPCLGGLLEFLMQSGDKLLDRAVSVQVGHK